MSVRHLLNYRVPNVLLICCIFFSYFPGLTLSAVVTLKSIKIYKTHEWLKGIPTVYFTCKGENKTILPDVRKAHEMYSFKGEESWQPLTKFKSKKCKRCGFYEKDRIISDDIFDEWEFCPSDFTSPHGNYVRHKEKELIATFQCPECLHFGKASSTESESKHHGKKGKHIAVVVLLIVLGSTILILGVVGAYKYWQKKRREQDQARFLKLFEDGNELEDELDLDNI